MRKLKFIFVLNIFCIHFLFYATEQFISTFGESIVSTRDAYDINIQFQYGVSDSDVTETISSTGSIISSDSLAILSTGAGATGSAQMQSKQNLAYKAGHESYLFFTAAFLEGGVVTSSQWIGLFDDNEGFAVGYDDTDFSILFRRDGGTDTVINQSSFNLDTLDGTGASGFTIDPTKLNVYRISFGWLGASPITFQVQDEEGNWIAFHRIEYPNSETEPSVLNASIPIRAQVGKTAGASDLQLATACWNAGSVSGNNNAGKRYFSYESPFVFSFGSTETHIATFRRKVLFNSVDNKKEVNVTFASPSGTGFFGFFTISQVFLVRMRRNATVIGTSFVDVNPNSTVEVSTSGTFSAGTGSTVLILFGNPTDGGGINQRFINPEEYNVGIKGTDTLTITYERISATPFFIGSGGIVLSWEEY